MKSFLAITTFLVGTALASCDNFFPNNKEITIPNTVVLCNSFYATVYDEKNERAFFSTELVQTKSGAVERTNNFHADSRVPNSPTPSDYDRVGLDRGHLVPAADAGTQAQMSDTFLMTNMTPQQPTVNRISWKDLEEHVRTENAKWIVTGAVYGTNDKTISKQKIMIPDSYYKVVYLTNGNIEVYVANNTVGAKVTDSTVSDLDKLTGLKF